MGLKKVIISILQTQISGKNGIEKVDSLLNLRGGVISLLMLDNPNDEEGYLLEEVINPQDCLMKISLWPWLGSLQYHVPTIPITVMFLSGGNANLDAVEIVADSNDINMHSEGEPFIEKLAHDIHNAMESKRTIVGWELNEEMGFAWEDELKRVREGIFLDHERILIDLRRE